MKAKISAILVCVAFLTATPNILNAQTPLGTGFTYQGELRQAGETVTGSSDMTFRLHDDPNSGNLIAEIVVSAIDVVDGLFTAELDFGTAAFNGDARWLEIEVEFPSGAGNWTILSPRQPVSATPYALMASETVGVDGRPWRARTRPRRAAPAAAFTEKPTAMTAMADIPAISTSAFVIWDLIYTHLSANSTFRSAGITRAHIFSPVGTKTLCG